MNKNGSHWIRPEKRQAIYARDDFRCCYCGSGITDGVMLTLDHVQPRELGGENEAGNLVTACLHCNAAKRDLPLRQFIVVLTDQGQDPQLVARRVRNAQARKVTVAK